MLLKDLWDIFETYVFPVPSTETLFNQYRDSMKGLDLRGAEKLRRRNLHNYFASFRERPGVLVVGEAAGPWGARFSGIPFTGERMLAEGMFPFKGKKTSTQEPPYQESSAVIFWKAMLPHIAQFILVNSVPFHPHKKGEPLSIRTPTRAELKRFSPVLREVASALRPSKVVAVGRKAEQSLGISGIDCAYVRHPSQGGAGAFVQGMERLFGAG